MLVAYTSENVSLKIHFDPFQSTESTTFSAAKSCRQAVMEYELFPAKLSLIIAELSLVDILVVAYSSQHSDY